MVQRLVSPEMNKTLIGLTGIFGSGKSAVAKIFENLGACLIDCDQISHEALMPKAKTFKSIAELFPQALKSEDEGLDRKNIAEIVFSNSEKRKALEEIVHPYVLERIAIEAAATSKDFVVVEVPLLFEAGFDVYFDFTIVVTSNEEIILERLKQKGFSEMQIKSRWQAQLSLDEKKEKTNFVIDNSGQLSQTVQETEKIWNHLLTCSKGEK